MVGAFWRGEITVRKLRALVANLPPGGAFYRATQGHGWTETEALLADVYDAVMNAVTAVYRAAPASKRRHIANPKPHPRPGQARTRTVGDTSEHDPRVVLRYLEQLKPPPEGG